MRTVIDNMLERLRSQDRSINELRACSAEALKNYIYLIRVRYRNNNYLDDAIREYTKLIEYFSEEVNTDERMTRIDLSIIEYEAGYVELMRGNYEKARNWFERSRDAALLDNDFVRVEIGAFMSIQTQTFAYSVVGEQDYQAMVRCLDRLAVYREKLFGSALTLCTNWMTNFQIRLFNTAVDINNPEEAELRYEQLLADKQLKEYRENPDLDGGYTLILFTSFEALLLCLKKDYESALKNFAIYLDLDLSKWGTTDQNFIDKTSKIHEIARDYLYAGLALESLNEMNRAKAAFAAGLTLNPNNLNHFYQRIITGHML